MGWQARLKKEDKPEFVRTCNKCGGTGIKKTITEGVYKDPRTGFRTFNGDVTIPCKCQSAAEPLPLTEPLPTK